MTRIVPKTSRTKVARILIVDDHPIVRDGLIAAMSRYPDLQVCGEASTIADAIKLIDTEVPDLTIIDLSLPDGSGLELIKRIKAHDIATKMLVLSMSDESLYAERVLRAGASGFLHKQEAREKLINAIRQILDGHIFVSEAISERLLQQVMGGNKPLQASPISTLSDRELEVFELIGQGHSSSDIAHRLHLGIKTIETHRYRIKEKLNLKNGAEVVRHATQWVLEKR